MEQGDRERLVRFLERSEDVLSFVLGFTRDRIPEQFHQQLDAAWSRVRQRFPEVAEEVRRVEIDQLESHGLTGPELDFKMSVFDGYYDAFLHFRRLQDLWASPGTPFGDTLDELEKGLKKLDELGGGKKDAPPDSPPVGEGQEEQQKKKAKSALEWLTRKLMKIINSALGSLEGIPGAGAIKELKDAVELLTEK